MTFASGDPGHTFPEMQHPPTSRTPETEIPLHASLVSDIIGTFVRESPDHVVILDHDLRYIYVNDIGLRDIGKQSDDVIGKRPTDMFPQEIADRISAEFQMVLRDGGSMIREIEYESTSGWKRFEYALAPIRNETGQVTHVISTTRDITEKAVLIETLMLRDRAITAASGGIIIADPNLPDCPIIYANPGFERLTGYSHAEILGKNCRFLQGADTRQEEVDKLRAAIHAQHSCTVIFENYRKDGTHFWNELTMTPVHDSNGRLVHFLGVQSDITERVQAQEALAVALQREQRIATTLQRSLLLTPPEKFPGLYVATLYAPAWDEALIGGDFYDAVPLENGCVALVVGDASGKGIDAAARTIEVKFALRVYLREDPNPARALSRLNDFVCDSQRFEEPGTDITWPFISLTLCVVDTRNHIVTFATAGAEPPLLVCDGDANAVGGGDDAGLPLGILPKQEYSTVKRPFITGHTLVLTTDGVTEARQKGDLFGYDRMAETACDALKEEEDKGNEMSPATLKVVGQRVVDAATTFANGKLTDDVCFLVARAIG